MTKITTVLRALNLLEPGRNILSITKTAMWLSVAAVTFQTFAGAGADMTSAIALFSTSSLYAWRRFVMWKTGEYPKDTINEPAIPAG